MNRRAEEDPVRSLLAARRKPDKGLILEPPGRTIIYGAGQTGRQVLGLLRRHDVEIDCFLDQNGGDRRAMDGVPIFQPDDPRVDRAARVILALFNDITDVLAVRAKLRRIGFARMLTFTELFMHFDDELPTKYWLGPPGAHDSHVAAITAALGLFADGLSRELFLSFLRFRLTGELECMPPPQVGEIYFPPALAGARKPDRFIDCGAFTGDTLAAVQKRFGPVQSVRAFEPDLDNFRKLVELNQRVSFSRDTLLVPCGVWSATGPRSFTMDGSPSSRVSDQGRNVIQCVALDDCLGRYQPTLIKMDIEGAEPDALEGGRRMIEAVKPDLAISVYHEPDHLWRIPLLIKGIAPGYEFHLRSHGYNGYDTVLYARHRAAKASRRTLSTCTAASL